LYICVVYDCV